MLIEVNFVNLSLTSGNILAEYQVNSLICDQSGPQK